MHLGLTPVHGRLRRFDGRIQVADPLENSSVEVVIDSNGVDSDDDTRDAHLRSADFLDVDVHPEIHFKSDGLTRRDATHWRVDGICPGQPTEHPGRECHQPRPDLRSEPRCTGSGPRSVPASSAPSPISSVPTLTPTSLPSGTR